MALTTTFRNSAVSVDPIFDNLTVRGTLTATTITGGGASALSGPTVTLTGTSAVANAVRLNASNAAGGIDVDAGTGGIAVDTTGALSLDAAGASSNVTLTSTGAAQDFTIALAGAFDSSLILSSTGTAADALQITASAGGIDITATGAAGEDIDISAPTSSVNITGSEAVADAIVLSAPAGGIDIVGSIAAVNAVDIDAPAGGVAITGGLAAADAIDVDAPAGGINMTAGIAAATAFDLDAPAGGFDLNAALQVNIDSSQAAADAVRIFASGAAGGIDVNAGTGGINISSTTTAAGGVTIEATGVGGGVTLTPEATANVTVGGARGVVSSVASGFVPFIISAAQDAVTDTAAVSVANYYSTLTTTGAAVPTLADGTIVGQLKKIQMIVDVGDSVLTPTNLNGGATITFADVGDTTELLWDGAGWQVLSLYNIVDGATAPVLA